MRPEVPDLPPPGKYKVWDPEFERFITLTLQPAGTIVSDETGHVHSPGDPVYGEVADAVKLAAAPPSMMDRVRSTVDDLLPGEKWAKGTGPMATFRPPTSVGSRLASKFLGPSRPATEPKLADSEPDKKE